MTVLLEKPRVETVRAKSPDRFKWAGTVISILVWQLLALLLVEGILYSAGIGEEEIFKLDRQVGFVHMSNKRITWRQEGNGARSYFDADGMREPNLTVAKGSDTYRIALLGDSQVEGLQVPIQDTFGQVLNRRLSEQLKQQLKQQSNAKHKQVQVLNFAISGYSTVQEYLQLKTKVFKYQPDLVILGYSARDLFENWSPPDQAMTNVRPLALQLPGAHLVVDSGPVVQWMHTPRAKFLAQISWLREHSHIWGLIAAQEQQLTLSNPSYKAVCTFISQPGKSIRAAIAGIPSTLKSFGASLRGLRQNKSSLPQSSIQPNSIHSSINPTSTHSSSVHSAPSAVPVHSDVNNGRTVQSAPEAVASGNNQAFDNLMKRTMGSLLAEMKAECVSHNAQFSVLVMPDKQALCPDNHAQQDASNDYAREVATVHTLCQEENILFLDCEQAATTLTAKERHDLYFNVHLTPAGHTFVAEVLQPFVSASFLSRFANRTRTWPFRRQNGSKTASFRYTLI